MQNFRQNIKRIITLCSFLAATLFTNAQQASSGKLNVELTTSPSSKVFKAGISDKDSSSLKFKVWFANPQEEKVSIRINSVNGILFFKKFTDNSYAQVFDLKGLEDGVYTIEISKKKQRFDRKIVISTDMLVLRKKIIY